MRSRFLEIFHSKSIPAHREIGMKILGSLSFHRRHRHLFFMRGFADLASREAMKAKFHARALWKEELEHVLLPMLAKYEVVVVEDSQHLIDW